MSQEEKKYNALGRPGRIAVNPAYVVTFKGQDYGFEGGPVAEVLWGLAYCEGFGVGKVPEWYQVNKDEKVVIRNDRGEVVFDSTVALIPKR